MRSRYAAFAVGAIDYLVATTHPSHADAKEPVEELRESIRRVATAHKYTGLTVLDAREDGDAGQVLFRARVFLKGKDFSFTELSEFGRDAGRWKYLAGRFVEGAWENLTIATVDAMRFGGAEKAVAEPE